MSVILKPISILIFAMLVMSSVGTSEFSIEAPDETIVWERDPSLHILMWVISNSTPVNLTYDIRRDGIHDNSATLYNTSAASIIIVACSIPVSSLPLGDYRYTLVATDGMNTRFSSVVVHLIEVREEPIFIIPTWYLLLTAMVVLTLTALAYVVRNSKMDLSENDTISV